MIDFGMPVLMELASLEENFALAQKLGLSFVELNMNFPACQAEALENTAYFQTMQETYGIYFTIHLDENLNVADFNQAVASAYVQTVIRAIRAAKEMGAPVLNMHMNHGVQITLPDRKAALYGWYQDEYMEAMRRFGDACEKAAGDTDIRICIENTDGYRDYERDAVQMLLEREVFALTWDIGHSRMASEVDEAFLMEKKDRLYHFHVHDANDGNCHMTLGTGEIDLKKRLSLARECRCRCVVETKTVEALRQSVRWLRENQWIN